MQALQLHAHLHAQLRIQVGERLVEQEHLRVAHDGAPDGDALALPAGELPRLALEQRLDAEDLGRFRTRFSISSFGYLRICRPKAMFWYTLLCG